MKNGFIWAGSMQTVKLKYKQNFGFTLAEVLITLGIIGVVAALTLPSLITKYRKEQAVNQFKKSYSELYQAVKLSESKFGLMETWDFQDFETADERVNYFYDNYLSPNIKVLKTCLPENQGECWASTVYTLKGGIKTDEFYDKNGNKTFITASGASYLMWLHGTGNGSWIWVDIDGPNKGYNTLGKDIFPIVMHWGNAEYMPVEGRCIPRVGIFPYGLHCQETHTRDEIKNGFEVGRPTYNCLKNSGRSSAGALCGALIMSDGWKMAPDYPW